MKKFSELMGIRPLGSRELCRLALLTAITVILAIYATFRVGNVVKIPMKFISVFTTGALFGPVPAALTAFLGDILNTLLVPVGAWLPGISFTEAVSGFVFGVFFYNRFEFSRSYAARAVMCAICQATLDIFVSSFFLSSAGYFASYFTAIAVRLPASVAKLFIQGAVMLAGGAYLPIFSRQVHRR